MAAHRILLIQGHPDALIPHLGHALEDAYAQGAEAAGHEVRRVHVARLDFPLLHSQLDWEGGTLPPFLEQVARPGFAFKTEGSNQFGKKGLVGRSARVVVTMGMPALLYRWYFRAHSVKNLERNILGSVGIAPVNETLIGMVDKLGDAGVQKWTDKLRQLGGAAQ